MLGRGGVWHPPAGRHTSHVPGDFRRRPTTLSWRMTEPTTEFSATRSPLAMPEPPPASGTPNGCKIMLLQKRFNCDSWQLDPRTPSPSTHDEHLSFGPFPNMLDGNFSSQKAKISFQAIVYFSLARKKKCVGRKSEKFPR